MSMPELRCSAQWGALLIVFAGPNGGCIVGDDSVGSWVKAGRDERAADGETSEIPLSYGLVPAQTFAMGCTPGQSDCEPSERPVTTVTLTHALYVGLTEVTQSEFEAQLGYNPTFDRDCGSRCPVDSLSWHESAAYANAVSAESDLELCYACSGDGADVECEALVNPYTCGGYRLPTEAEWEAAARCGEDRLYSGSVQANAVAWTEQNSGYSPHAVGELSANACGLYDMSGNVWEWTQDWSSDYDGGEQIDPSGPTSGSYRIFRGGSWDSARNFARVAFRAADSPDHRGELLGFRLVRTAP